MKQGLVLQVGDDKKKKRETGCKWLGESPGGRVPEFRAVASLELNVTIRPLRILTPATIYSGPKQEAEKRQLGIIKPQNTNAIQNQVPSPGRVQMRVDTKKIK